MFDQKFAEIIPINPAAGDFTVLDDAVQMQGRHLVRVDRSRDRLLTDFGRAMLDD